MLTRRHTAILIMIIVIIFAMVTIGTYNALTKPFPGHNDFLSRWEGARSYWVDGLNPYGEEASLNIQHAIYGRAVLDSEDPGLFAYPFYTVFVVFPIINLDYSWASAIWMTLLEALLLFSLLLSLDLFEWRPKPLLLGGLLLWTLFMYFSARGLLLGQPGHLVYFLEVLAIWGLYKKNDSLAGVALALSTIKPQMGFLLVPFLLLWALRVKRWRFMGAFVVSFGVLMGLSFLLMPPWLSDWLAQVALYPSYTELGGPVWIASHLPWLGINELTGKWQVSGGAGDTIELIISAILALYMLWTWVDVLIRRKTERFLWTIMITLLITHLIAPRTASPHFIVFTIPLVFYLRELTLPKVKLGTLWATLLLIALFILPWLHFLLTVEGEFEHPTTYLPIPFLMLVVLLATRKMWWHKANLIDEVSP